MEPNQTGGRRQRTPEEIIKLLEEYETSQNITVKEYCAMIGISDATFYGWRKQYKEESEPKQAGFIELVSNDYDQLTQSLFAEVKGIKLYQPVPAEYLKSLAL